MAAERFPSEVPIFYWDKRQDPKETFRILDTLLKDLHNRVLKVLDDHAILIDNGQLLSFTVATLPVATAAARMIYVSDEAGGAVPAFSDGTNWRRVTDRVIVS